MKKFLLSMFLMGAVAFANAQVLLNEVYTDPNLPGHQEFFELYNSSVSNIPVDLDCYQLITWSAAGNGGFYVLDLPTSSLGPKSFYVGAATNPFSAQGSANQNLVPNFSWNALPASASLTYYARTGANSSTYTATPITSGLDDFFKVNTGNGTNTGVFLFRNGVYINGFLGGVGSSSVPSDVKSMPNMPITVSCGGSSTPYTITWSTVTLAENVGSNAGSDNGFARTSDGKCGTWVKTSSSVNHTPGRSNGSAAGLAGSLTTSQVIHCGTPGVKAYVSFDVTAIPTGAVESDIFAVEVQVYNDVNRNQALDATDIYINSKPQASLASPSDTVQYLQNDADLILVYKTILGCFDKVVSVRTDCISLPVNFKSFKADRKSSSSVGVTWTTASEQNNKGFFVQRNDGSGWKNVAFVFSAANGGNSSSDLSYSFNDVNTETAISQYRVQQVDLDGMARYSTIAAVRGLGTSAKLLVYPNPSANGNVNVVFDDNNSVRDVQVSDAAGRTIKQFKSITNNLLLIENLKSGFYTIKVTNRNTAATTVEKVVVK